MSRLAFSRAVCLVVVVVGGLHLGGCYTLRADLPGTLRGDIVDEQVRVVGRFDKEYPHTFFLFGLVNDPRPNVFADDMLAAVKAKGADGMANVRIDTYSTVTDLVFSQVTFGLIAPRTYRVRGDIVKIEAPPLPGEPL